MRIKPREKIPKYVSPDEYAEWMRFYIEQYRESSVFAGKKPTQQEIIKKIWGEEAAHNRISQIYAAKNELPEYLIEQFCSIIGIDVDHYMDLWMALSRYKLYEKLNLRMK